MRTLYLGTPCEFSRLPLLALLDAGIEVCGVVIPAERGAAPITQLAPAPLRSPLPIAGPYLAPSIVEIAWERGIPVLAARALATPEVAATLAEAHPDVACAACFPQRIPASLLRLPPLGWLNVHPSLLPAYRGPAPLFWILRDGAPAGVTVHFMDQNFDTGDIAAQAPIVLPDGASGAQADRACAALGGRLLAETLHRLQDGTCERRPQAAGGSYNGWPAPEDWTMSMEWSARRTFNFMRGTADWGQTYRIVVGDRLRTLSVALGYEPDTTLAAPYVRSEQGVAIQCTPGVLYALEVGV